ncbi:AGAP008779-PA-like protein [Anopheles sinensis]|uniref:AGAP008779-PA-like protein n=1 Tax=Anopheles sinensis TaxID=74873 RepID=A0A084VMS7_ANOSI|nr:AGAP008779-PA-like protein [Anopheles sinensis]
MVFVFRFFRTKIGKLHEFLLRNSKRFLISSLLLGLATGTLHWLSIRYPALPMQLQENLRTFPVQITFCTLSLLSIGIMLSVGLYKRHLEAKARQVRFAIRQRYVDYIMLCLMVSVANSGRRHLQSPDKEGLTVAQLECYRQEIETAINRFRVRARKLLHEPPSSVTSSTPFLERYFRLDGEHFGEEILALKRDTNSLVNVPAIKGLLDC